MGLEGRIALKLAAVERRDAALEHDQSLSSVRTESNGSYIIVSCPQQLLSRVKGHGRHGRRCGVDARRRKGDASDLSAMKSVSSRYDYRTRRAISAS